MYLSGVSERKARGVVRETRMGPRSASGHGSAQSFHRLPVPPDAVERRKQSVSPSVQCLLQPRSVRTAAAARHHR